MNLVFGFKPHYPVDVASYLNLSKDKFQQLTAGEKWILARNVYFNHVKHHTLLEFKI